MRLSTRKTESAEKAMSFFTEDSIVLVGFCLGQLVEGRTETENWVSKEHIRANIYNPSFNLLFIILPHFYTEWVASKETDK